MKKILLIIFLTVSGVLLYNKAVTGEFRLDFPRLEPPEDPEDPEEPGEGDNNMYDLNDIRQLDPIEVMARTMYGEARGSTNEEIKNIGHVIINRVNSNQYPNTIIDVCLQTKQFSCWNDPPRDDNQLEVRQKQLTELTRYEQIKSLAETVKNRSYSPLPNVYHFLSKDLVNNVQDGEVKDAEVNWAIGMYVVYEGDHYFLSSTPPGRK